MEKTVTKLGGLLALLTIAYRNIWRNGRRTTLCVVAVAIAVFFNVFMESWMDGMMTGIEEVVRTYETGTSTSSPRNSKKIGNTTPSSSR